MTKDIDALWETAFRRLGAQLVPHVERMRFALRLFFRHEFLARGKKAVLRRAMDIGFAGA
jgi:hypothetical protein